MVLRIFRRKKEKLCTVFTKNNSAGRDIYEWKKESWGDVLHRKTGPAIIWPDGSKWWYIDGKKHRVDGPAIENAANKVNGWFINDKELDSDKVEKWIEENNIDLSTEEGQTAFILTWG